MRERETKEIKNIMKRSQEMPREPIKQTLEEYQVNQAMYLFGKQDKRHPQETKEQHVFELTKTSMQLQ